MNRAQEKYPAYITVLFQTTRDNQYSTDSTRIIRIQEYPRIRYQEDPAPCCATRIENKTMIIRFDFEVETFCSDFEIFDKNGDSQYDL